MDNKQLLLDATTLDELTCRTKPSPYYITPKPHHVEKMFKDNKLDIKDISVDLLADVVNTLSGGQNTSEIEDTFEAQAWSNKTIVAHPDGIHWLGLQIDGSTKQWFDHKGIALNSLFDTRTTYHNNMRTMLRSLDEAIGLHSLPGNTPLQKAITLIRMLLQQHGNSNTQRDRMQSPKFKPNEAAEQVAAAIRQAKSLSKLEQELMYGENNPAGDGGSGGGGECHPELKSVQIAQDMMSSAYNIVVRVARHLNTLSRVATGRSREREIDPEGRILDPRTIEDFNNMHKLSTSEWVYSKQYRNIRIATGVARTYERVIEYDKKQCLYMLVDASGSMAGVPAHVAGGCVMRILKAVVQDDAEIFLNFFDSCCRNELIAKTKQEAISVMDKVLHGSYSGGSTKIAPCTRTTIKRIEEILKTDKLSKPELMLVTDGDDCSMDLRPGDFGNIKFHVIIISEKTEGKHGELLELARSTGGVGIHIPTNMAGITQ